MWGFCSWLVLLEESIPNYVLPSGTRGSPKNCAPLLILNFPFTQQAINFSIRNPFLGMGLTINKYLVLLFSNSNHFSSSNAMMRKQLRTISRKNTLKNEDLRTSCIMFLTQEFIALEREIFELEKEDLFFPAPQWHLRSWNFCKDYLGLC